MDNSNEVTKWLEWLVGKRLTSILTSVYVPIAEGQAELIEVTIEVDGAARGKLLLSSDGESISYDPNPLKSADMGELGKIETKASPLGDAWNLIGAVVCDARLVRRGNILVGVELGFSTGSSLLLMNIGDRLLLLRDRGHPFFGEGVFVFESAI